MVGGMSKINKDIPPYVLCGRDPICYSGVNIVGLRRRVSSDVIRNIKDIYDTIYFAGYNITDGCAKVEAGFPQSEERDTILISSEARSVESSGLTTPGRKESLNRTEEAAVLLSVAWFPPISYFALMA